MKIKTRVLNAKAATERAQRRATALVSHGRTVITTGRQAAIATGKVLAENSLSILSQQKTALTTEGKGAVERAKDVLAITQDGLRTALTETIQALKEGASQVSEKVVRVPRLTRLEQAQENKISRKLKKAQKTIEAGA